MGLWVSLSVLNLSWCCQSRTVLLQAVPSLRTSEVKKIPLLSLDCWGAEEGNYYALRMTFFLMPQEKVEAKPPPQILLSSPSFLHWPRTKPSQSKSEEQQEEGSKLSRKNTPWQMYQQLAVVWVPHPAVCLKPPLRWAEGHSGISRSSLMAGMLPNLTGVSSSPLGTISSLCFFNETPTECSTCSKCSHWSGS